MEGGTAARMIPWKVNERTICLTEVYPDVGCKKSISVYPSAGCIYTDVTLLVKEAHLPP